MCTSPLQYPARRLPALGQKYQSGAMLRRLYGTAGHDITLENPAVPGVALEYTTFRQITDDVDRRARLRRNLFDSTRWPVVVWDARLPAIST